MAPETTVKKLGGAKCRALNVNRPAQPSKQLVMRCACSSHSPDSQAINVPVSVAERHFALS